MGDHHNNAGVAAEIEASKQSLEYQASPVVDRVVFRRVSRKSDGKQEMCSGETLLQVMHKVEESATKGGGTIEAELGGGGAAGDGRDVRKGDRGTVTIGATAGQSFMGVNRAIENRVTVNLTMMKWDGSPKTVLIIEKSGDTMRFVQEEEGYNQRLSHETVKILERIARFCHFSLKLDVMVEARVKRELPSCTFLQCCDHCEINDVLPRTAMPKTQDELFETIQKRLRSVDFCIAVGHDGAVVSCAGLFESAVPPVLPIALQHQGIMMRLGHEYAEQMLQEVVTEGFNLGMRVRLRCSFYSFKSGETQVRHRKLHQPKRGAL